MIILDSNEESNSILNYKQTELISVGGLYQVEITPFLKDYPFKNHLILKDPSQICTKIIEILENTQRD